MKERQEPGCESVLETATRTGSKPSRVQCEQSRLQCLSTLPDFSYSGSKGGLWSTLGVDGNALGIVWGCVL